MPTSGNASLEELKRRVDRQEERMDKYDEIITDLHTIVVRLETQAKTNYKWVMMLLLTGATLVGALVGAFATHLLK